jgi:hypothetical protein
MTARMSEMPTDPTVILDDRPGGKIVTATDDLDSALE